VPTATATSPTSPTATATFPLGGGAEPTETP
jgi:hypothetical protein